MGRAVYRVLPAIAGLALSVVLEWVHVRTHLGVATDRLCDTGPLADCTSIALSRFSVVGGLPLPFWGSAFFVALGTAAYQRSRLWLPLATLGAIVSVALLVESWFVVGTLCMLCEAVHGCALLAFVIAWRERQDARSTIRRNDFGLVIAVPVVLLLIARVSLEPYWLSVETMPDVATGTTDAGYAWFGAREPKVVVEEFVDYGCPHCAIASRQLQRFALMHPDEIRVVRRHRPRTRCRIDVPSSCLDARASWCAAEQGRFWPMDTWLFAHAPGRAEIDPAAAIAPLKLDGPQFLACLDAAPTFEKLETERRVSLRAGASFTPFYRVDDVKVPASDVIADLRRRL